MNFLWDNLFKDHKKNRTRIQTLKDNILFKDLSAKELSLIEKIINVRQYRAGEKIFRQGEMGVGMYIICEGSVNVFTEENDSITNEPKTTFVTRLFAGDFFGELALVEESGRRTATILAHEDSHLIGFFRPDLIEVMNRSPIAGVKILLKLGEVLGIRLRETTAKIVDLRNKMKHIRAKEEL